MRYVALPPPSECSCSRYAHDLQPPEICKRLRSYLVCLLQLQVGEDPVYAVQVERSSMEQMLNEKRLVLHLTDGGKIKSVSDTGPLLFGFEPTELVGKTLDSIIDVFADWKASGRLPASQLAVLQ